jgi:phosphoribosylanthranilate isomerase
MKYPNNLAQLTKLRIDMIGFIFYDRSSRFVETTLSAAAVYAIPARIQRVGVFVNDTTKNIVSMARWLRLNAVQLHGSETPDECWRVKNTGITVIKAFHVADDAEFAECDRYEGACDFFLFDTKTREYGGSGIKFKWEALSNYSGKTPFFLSGGIGPADAAIIKEIQHPALYGIDLNSKFETKPGWKDVDSIRTFLDEIKTEIKK